MDRYVHKYLNTYTIDRMKSISKDTNMLFKDTL